MLLYGAGAYTGDTIGGGAGYSSIITSGNYEPTNAVDFLHYLGAHASSGETIYIPASASIDLTGESDLAVPEGVTIASNRGSSGSLGGLIFTSTMTYRWGRLFLPASHVRFTGLRLRGPDSTIGPNSADPTVTGIECDGYHGLIVDNNELYNWPYAAVQVTDDSLVGLSSADRAYVHHNNIHHNRREGNGYGVGVQAASVLCEANLFDYCRHYIMCDRNLSGQPAANYDFRYNICGPNIYNTLVDAHGGNDSQDWGNPNPPDVTTNAGGTIIVRYNDFQSATAMNVGIRGVPAVSVTVYRNWTYRRPGYEYDVFHQYLENLKGSVVDGYTILGNGEEYVRMFVYDNWYDETAPPVGEDPPVGGTVCTTAAATHITSQSALLHGYTTGLSVGEYATRRGFQWDTDSHSLGGYADGWYEDGTWTADMAFEHVIQDLGPDTEYFFRAYVVTGVGG
jgi:hypothetical protein